MDAASERHPEVPYSPVLIDATYAGLITGAADAPLVIPALNRDGDCLSDFVLPMFGSIAGAESVLLALDADYEATAVMAEAPHGTAPALQGKDIANPMAMILAAAALLHYAGTLGHDGADTRLAGDLRVGARGDRHRRPDAGPRRPRVDDRVHRRGDLSRPDEDRDLVFSLALRPKGSPAASRAGSSGGRCGGPRSSGAGRRASPHRPGRSRTGSGRAARRPRPSRPSRCRRRPRRCWRPPGWW